jgi:hypothetical protein
MLVGFTRKENKPVPDIHFNNLSLPTPTREMPVASVASVLGGLNTHCTPV